MGKIEAISRKDFRMTKRNDIKQVPVDKGNYIAGFVDGEGSFWVTCRQRKDYATGWKFSANFNVSNGDIAVLEMCKKYLGCGKIRLTKPEFYTLEVEDRDILKTFIVPFFQRFGFYSNKKKSEFRVFQLIIQRIDQGIETLADLEELLALRKELNRYRKARFNQTDQMIRETFQPKR
jgi:LAGLIDADG endonuclease